MNILDENIPETQRAALVAKKLPVRQIGLDVGRKGMKDREIIPLLRLLNRPTFFTLDDDFYERRLCHEGHCLVHLAVEEDRVAEYVRRLLRHPECDAKVKRMGSVIRVSPTGLVTWRIRRSHERRVPWT